MKTLRGVGTATAAAALAVTAAAGCSVTFNPRTHHETRSHTIAGTFPSLRVDGNDGRVEVVGTDSPEIKVVEYLSWSNPNNKPKTERITRDGTLTLKDKCGRAVIGYNGCGVGYRVEIPRATQVDLRTDAGELRVSGLTGNSVRLRGDTGVITVAGVRTRSLTVSSDSGRIEVDGQADTADLHSDSGEIAAAGLRTSRLTAGSGSGLVRLTLTAVPVGVDVRSASGAVQVRLPEHPRGYAFTLTSDAGARKISPALRQDSASPHRVRIGTDSGSIDVAPAPGA